MRVSSRPQEEARTKHMILFVQLFFDHTMILFFVFDHRIYLFI